MKKIFVILTILTMPPLAAAQGPAKFAAGGGISAAGLDGVLAYKLHDQVNLWRTVSEFGVGRNFNGKSDKKGGSVDFSAKASIFKLGVLGDFHPLANGFRLTRGVVLNKNSLSLTAKPKGGGVYTIASRTYDADDVGDLRGKAEWKKPGLFLGLGYGNTVASKGLSFSAEVGGIVTRGPSTSLTARCGEDIAGTDVCDRLHADVGEERRKLQNKLGAVRVFPILRVGLNYSF